MKSGSSDVLHEAAVCDQCRLAAVELLTSQGRARVHLILEERILDRAGYSADRNNDSDVRRYLEGNAVAKGEQTLDEWLQHCRLCNRTSREKSESGEGVRLTVAARTQGAQLVSRPLNRMSFGLPFAICQGCDEGVLRVAPADRRREAARRCGFPEALIESAPLLFLFEDNSDGCFSPIR